MKIALLASEGGGIFSVSFGLAQALSKIDVEMTIFLSSSVPRTSFDTVDENLKIINLPIANCPPKSVWFLARYFHNIADLLGDYDIVHAVNPELGVCCAFSKPKLNRPFMTTLHGSNRAYLKAFMGQPMKSWVRSDFAFHVLELPLHEVITKTSMAKSNKIIVPSFTTLNELKTCENLDISKATVIANGVNFEEIEDGRKSEDFAVAEENNELTILYAGRLFWMKGLTYVLDAFCILRRQFGNLRLRIFGKGPLENRILKLINDRGLGNSVFFGGFLPHGELINEVRKADVILFPSLYESQPVFLLEAMACKKPIVAFNLAYAREIIEDQTTGLLAQTGDLNDLCEKLSRVLNDAELRVRIGQNGYEYVRKNHDWNKQAKKYLKVYEALITDERN